MLGYFSVERRCNGVLCSSTLQATRDPQAAAHLGVARIPSVCRGFPGAALGKRFYLGWQFHSLAGFCFISLLLEEALGNTNSEPCRAMPRDESFSCPHFMLCLESSGGNYTEALSTSRRSNCCLRLSSSPRLT